MGQRLTAADFGQQAGEHKGACYYLSMTAPEDALCEEQEPTPTHEQRAVALKIQAAPIASALSLAEAGEGGSPQQYGGLDVFAERDVVRAVAKETMASLIVDTNLNPAKVILTFNRDFDPEQVFPKGLLRRGVHYQKLSFERNLSLAEILKLAGVSLPPRLAPAPSSRGTGRASSSSSSLEKKKVPRPRTPTGPGTTADQAKGQAGGPSHFLELYFDGGSRGNPGISGGSNDNVCGGR